MKANKLLLTFIAIVVLGMSFIWQFVQSDTFGTKLSPLITEYTGKYLKADLKFKNISFTFFPPGIELEEVAVEKDGVTVGAKSLGLNFDILKSMQRELTIESIYLHDASIDLLKMKIKNNQSSGKINIKVSDYARRIEEELPVKIKKVSLERTHIKAELGELFLREFSISPRQDDFFVHVDLEKVQTSKIAYDLSKTKLFGDLVVKDKEVYIESLNVLDPHFSTQTEGRVLNYFSDKRVLDLKTNITGNIKNIHQYLEFKKVGSLNTGILNLDSHITGELTNLNLSNRFIIKKANTSFADADEIKGEFKLDSKEIRFMSLELRNNEESLILDKDFQLFDFKTKKFVEENIFASVKKLRLRNALKYLKKNLSILDSEMTGKLEFELNEKDFHFYVKDEAEMENTSLTVNKKKGLNIPFLTIKDANFSVVPGKFHMKATLNGEGVDLTVKGEVSNKGTYFETTKGAMDLETMGEMFGFNMKGKGRSKIIVDHNKKKSEIKIENELSHFNILDFSMRKIQADVLVNLRDSDLIIDLKRGSQGVTRSKGKVTISLSDLSLKGTVRHDSINYGELLTIYKPIMEPLRQYNFDFTGKWRTEFKLSGKASPEDIEVEGKFYGLDTEIFDEYFEKLDFQYRYKKKRLSFKNIRAAKASGKIKADVEIFLENLRTIFAVELIKLPMLEINNMNKSPLRINGNLDGTIKGAYEKGLRSLNLNFFVTDSRLGLKKLEDSYLQVNFSKDLLDMRSSILGGKISLDSKNYFSKKKMSKTSIKMRLDDIKEVLGANRFINISESNINGDIYGQGFLTYNLLDQQLYGAELTLDRAKLDMNNINLNYLNNRGPQILIKDGNIKKWNVEARGKNIYFVSKGEGSTLKEFNVESDFRVDAAILEVFNKVISKSTGGIIGKLRFFQNLGRNDYDLQIKSSDINLSTKSAPVRLNDTKFYLRAKNHLIRLENFESKLNSGRLLANGDISLENLFPKIDMNFKAIHAGVNFLDKSSFSISGDGKLAGDNFPYRLEAKVNVEKMEVLNEFTDFLSGENKISSDLKYLPDDQVGLRSDLVELDVDIRGSNPLKIKNSMADIYLEGALHLKGSENSLVGEGKFSRVYRDNKLFFKGNTYNVKKANFIFNYDRSLFDPLVDIETNAVVNDYSLIAKVKGPAKKFDLVLSSTPALTENDILSLIAFGYTEDISSNLSDEQRTSMTQAGIGALLFDQFKINDTLKKELGIRVNLGTEISNETTSYLSQKNATGNTGSRVTSATKIEVKKDLTEEVDLAVSSTVGGTAGQRQRMNINYNISEKMSLEGVYESRTDTQSASELQDTSLGADVKFRWTFE